MMRQYYYTSTRHGVSGSAGFQCKAKSPGLTAEDVDTINKIIGYRIPPMLDETNLATHPPALRYVYLGSDRCVLANSQSNGPDENGRPGNFFGHAIMTHPEDFRIYPPIMFWRNKFWKSEDRLERTDLPETSAFDVEPSLDFDQVWDFIKYGNRREWFRTLLAAVIRYDTEKRPIVILDAVDNVARWIAAVTFALPGHYRPLLSFATYHHDPYQASFLITGTTSDSRFRFSSDEYVSYFLLNAEANRVSEVGASTYANFVTENFTPDLYDEKLLDFFTMCSTRLPSRSLKDLDNRLDAATTFFLTFREGRIAPSSAEAQESLLSFMSYIDERSTLGQDDIDEVRTVADTLLSSLPGDYSPHSLQAYGRVLSILKRHDPGFDNRCPQDLQAWLFTLKQDVVIVDRHLQMLESAYGAALGDYAGRGEFLNKLSASLSGQSWKTYALVWARLIPLIAAGPENKISLEAILGHTLSATNQLALPGDNQPGEEALTLLRTVIKSSRLNKSLLLGAATDWYQRNNGAAYFWFYYELTRNMPMTERTAFRKDVLRIAPDIILYEVQQDSRNCPLEESGNRLSEWLIHLGNTSRLNKRVVAAWLDACWNGATPTERKQIAEQFLNAEDISVHLEPAMKTRLLDNFMTGLTLKRLPPTLVDLYEKYRQHEGLSDTQRALIDGSLALTQYAFPEGSVSNIQTWLAGADDARYRIEAAKFMDVFFSRNANVAEHVQMLEAIYMLRHGNAFWELYWARVRVLVSDYQRIRESAELLTFWFEESAEVLRNSKYLTAAFFLELPLILEEVSDEKSSQRATRALSEMLSRKDWYLLIEGYFIQRKSGLRDLFSRQ